uniref:Uncharacterized protein n=1 Tax=Arundo donax TaxID=35708 RepID=A0A0A9DJN1_ARUDO
MHLAFLKCISVNSTEKIYHRQDFYCASYNILKCRIWNCQFSFCLTI